ncbi:hypothetical protein BAE44_0007772, partial [Dichanthelium oligosanthes]
LTGQSFYLLVTDYIFCLTSLCCYHHGKYPPGLTGLRNEHAIAVNFIEVLKRGRPS